MKSILKNRQAQTSLIMIVLAAIALIFFAATLNWGKIAGVKTQTTIAANMSASDVTSGAASYGEQVLQETMGGKVKICKSTSVWTAIAMVIIIIIMIIITIVSWGTATAYTATQTAACIAMIASAAMSIVSLVLQVMVVQPGLTTLWNKMQKDMPIQDQFIERGIQNGLLQAGGDPVLIPDYFDMDTDGLFKGNSKDMVGRFGFLYTERLKLLQPNTIPNLDAFLKSMKELTFVEPSVYANCAVAPNNDPDLEKRAPCCRINAGPPVVDLRPANCSFAISDPCQDSSRSECNSCCLPLYDKQLVVNPRFRTGFRSATPEVTADQCIALGVSMDLCNARMIYKRLRPESCSNDFIPAQCSANSAYGSLYPFTYDPAAQNIGNNKFLSLLEKLGRDDEHPAFMKRNGIPSTDLARNPNGTQDADALGRYRNTDATGTYEADRGKYEGVFPLLGAMIRPDFLASKVKPADLTDLTTLDKVEPILRSLIAPSADPVVAEGMCAQGATGPGFSWKSGAARYCSAIGVERVPGGSTQMTLAQWPYFANCPGRDQGQACLVSGNVADCAGCVAGSGQAWPDDPLDDMVYGLGEFTDWAKRSVESDVENIVNTFPEWYADAAQWFAPACTGSGAGSCADETFNSANPDTCGSCLPGGQEGLLRQYAKQLGGATPPLVGGDPTGGWYLIMDQWLKKNNLADANAWCVPTNAAGMSPQEKFATYTLTATANQNKLDCEAATPRGICSGKTPAAAVNTVIDLKASNSSYTNINTATINEVTQCLNWNQTNETRFQNCISACSSTSSTTADYNACYNLPRSLVNSFSTANAQTGVGKILPPSTTKINAVNRINCLNNCSAPMCGLVVPGFNAATMCVSGGTQWNKTTTAYTALAASIDTAYAGTLCRDYTKLVASRDAALAQDINPVTSFRVRYNFLNKLKEDAIRSRAVFKEAYNKLVSFIYTPASGAKSPVDLLIEARVNYKARTSVLPNFAIYGWQSEKQTVLPARGSGLEARGRWHIIRVETFAPTRCGNRVGCKGRMPWVRTYTKGFMKTTRCYELTDYTGNVYVRVTRYDEGNGNSIVKFANQAVTLWKFLGAKTSATGGSSGSVDTLSTACPGTGIRPDTLCALGTGRDLISNAGSLIRQDGTTIACPGINTPREEFKALRSAFMINDTSGTCFTAANALLNEGVKTESCAQYGLNGGHMGLKFIKCPPGSFRADSTTTE